MNPKHTNPRREKMARSSGDDGRSDSPAARRVLWGVKNGAPSWQEEVITETTNPDHIREARKWAEANGFDRFRVQTLDGERPDFVGAVTGKARLSREG